MERFNRCRLNLIAPGGVGRPEHIIIECITTNLLTSRRERSKVEDPHEAHHSGAIIQEWTKTKSKYHSLDDGDRSDDQTINRLSQLRNQATSRTILASKIPTNQAHQVIKRLAAPCWLQKCETRRTPTDWYRTSTEPSQSNDHVINHPGDCFID